MFRRSKLLSLEKFYCFALHCAAMFALAPSVFSLCNPKFLLCCRQQSMRYASRLTYTIANPIEFTEIVKKSRFIGKLSPFTTVDEALSIVKTVSEPKASHNCWAFRTSSNPSYERCSDDGEPGGSAGRPILNALESEGVVDAVVVVTRYFGGIKLGVGGLSRAYGSAAKAVIQAAERILVIPHSTLRIRTDVSDLGSLYQAVNALSSCTLSTVDSEMNVGGGSVNKKEIKDKRKGKEEQKNGDDDSSHTNHTKDDNNGVMRLSEEYSDDAISVILRLRMPSEFVIFFRKKVSDLCRGSAEVVEEKEETKSLGEDDIEVDNYDRDNDGDDIMIVDKS